MFITIFVCEYLTYLVFRCINKRMLMTNMLTRLLLSCIRITSVTIMVRVNVKWYLILCICYYYIPVSVYRLFIHKSHSPPSPITTKSLYK